MLPTGAGYSGQLFQGSLLTERVLQHVGELALPVGDVASGLWKGPQDVGKGSQAPVIKEVS